MTVTTNDREVVPMATVPRKRPMMQSRERMMASGADAAAINELFQRADEDGEDWVFAAEDVARQQETYAQAELDAGHTATAQYFFLAASAFYRVASYEIHDVTDEKVRLYQEMKNSFAKAAALFDPPLEEINIPYKDFDMHGWIYQPKNLRTPSPVVLMIGGATGFKEEFHAHAMLMVERGLPVLTIDAPGQGVTRYLNGGALEVETEKGISRIVDFLEADPRFTDIGIYGGSAGGYYVTRAAALDHRIDACAVYAGGYDLVDMITGDMLFRYYVHHFAVLLDTDDDKVLGLMNQMTMKGIAEQIECPLIMVHGDHDNLFSIEKQRRLLAEARSTDKRLVEYPSSFHGAPEFASRSFRVLADWMADHLLG